MNIDFLPTLEQTLKINKIGLEQIDNTPEKKKMRMAVIRTLEDLILIYKYKQNQEVCQSNRERPLQKAYEN